MRVRRNPIAGHNLFTTYRDLSGNTSLHRAVENHDYEQVKFYVEYPQLINSVNYCEETPLHYCTFSDFSEAAEEILKHDADINAINSLGQTPVMLAILNRSYKTIELLLRMRTVTVVKKGRRGKTIQEEKKVKVDPFITDYRELSLLHYALLSNDSRIKQIVFREMARRRIFFVQSSEPDWFNPKFITVYTKSSHRKMMLNECIDTFKWSEK